MIISRTPFRVSFFGGGTDYPAWYKENGGFALSATINKFCYITCRYLPPFFDYKYRVRYYQREEAGSIAEIKHPSARECLKFLDIQKGVEIVHHADLPARSGLGSSSTFTVGLLHALYALKNQMATKRELAINAIHVEQNMIQETVGSQDQTAAAFGGLNVIKFGGVNEIEVTPLIMKASRFKSFEDHIMLFFTGFARTASEVASHQIKEMPAHKADLVEMMDLVQEASNILEQDHDLKDFGLLLNEQWNLKRKMSSKISNPSIDEMYAKGTAAGAYGGKLLGAGGGGFMMFFVEPERQAHVKEALKEFLYVPCRIDTLGSQIIYYTRDEADETT